MLKEIGDMMEEMRGEIDEWFSKLPPHGKEAYAVPEADCGCVAWPCLRMLRVVIGYPASNDYLRSPRKDSA